MNKKNKWGERTLAVMLSLAMVASTFSTAVYAEGTLPAAPEQEVTITGTPGDETPAGDADETGDEPPAGDADKTGDASPAGDADKTGDETPAGDADETGDETPAGDADETGDETPAGDADKTGDETPTGDADETMPGIALMNEDDLVVYDLTAPNFEVTGIGNTFAANNVTFDMMKNVGLVVKDGSNVAPAEEAAKYKVVLASVTRSGTGYTWNGTDTTFTTPSTDNPTYTIEYKVQKIDDSSYVAGPFTRTVDVITDIQYKDDLTTDDEYINSASVIKYGTGTAPFDENDDPGNDSSPDNMTVRSFDTITYTINVASSAYTDGVYYKNGYAWYRFELPYTEDKATFDTNSMGWMSTEAGYEYKITEEDGKQVLTAARKVIPQEGQTNALPISSMTVNLSVKVLNMQKGNTVTPKAYVWMDHNEVDKDPFNPGAVCTNTDHTSAPNVGKEIVEIPIETVTVTSAPKYNVQLKQVYDGYWNGIDTFNFASGDDTALNKLAGSVHGRTVRYGVTLQLYNDTAAKGLRGVEYPQGAITFDVDLTSIQPDGSEATGNKIPLVWTYGPNVQRYKTVTVNGRDNSPYGTNYAAVAAPSNSYDTPLCFSSCNDGGTWTATQSGKTVHFTVDGYTIDPTKFPNTDLGGSLNYKDYYDTTKETSLTTSIGCFSAGDFSIVVPFDEGTTGTIRLSVNDYNLQATSVTGQKLSIVTDNSNQKKTSDDNCPLTIQLSEPGVYNNVIAYGDESHAWGQIVWDADGSAFANGRDIGAVGQSDYIVWGGSLDLKGNKSDMMSAANFLLKFDANAIEVNGSPILIDRNGGQNTTPTFLYAAKTDGSNWTNDAEMNGANEADLVYYSSLAALTAAGKTCVGILAEYRQETLQDPVTNNNKLIYKVPVKVKNNFDVAGKVYQILAKGTIWQNKLIGADGKTKVPSRLDVQNGSKTMPAASITGTPNPDPYKNLPTAKKATS